MLGSETDYFVGHSRDQREQRNADSETRPECMHRDRHVDEHGDDHDRHQKARSTARMISRIFLDRAGIQWVAILKCEHRLMLRSVILIHAADIFPKRNAPNEEQEESDTD